MESISIENRNNSFKVTEKMTRKQEIFNCYLLNGKMTARECLQKLGRHEMNEVRPRISELLKNGVLVEVGSKYCQQTDRNETIYELQGEYQYEI